MSQLLPIQDLISPKPEPKLTPSLVPAFRANAREMVETYVFTDTIRAHFDAILEPVATGHGQAFWVQAEYGAGKTHFLVTLAALLANTADDTLWQLVQDGHIRQAQKRLRASRLFPVVLSLRGESAGDPYFGRSLLDVLLEEGFGNALEAANLLEEVQVTAADDILAWLEHTASPAIRADAEAFVNQQGNQTLAAYRDNEGTDAVAALLSQYFGSVGIRPDIASGQKERLGHIYRQLTDEDGPGYDGLLVLIDEYEGWEKGHNTPEELSRDTELLETLGSLLPVDLGYQVYTVVASQSAVPAKLQGSQAGSRFINIPLLAQRNERDYDVIISRRALGLKQDRLPEINDFYTHYSQHFDFAQGLAEDEFRDVFPFQPRCFETIRHITARDLPTARSGLLVFWQVVNHADLLKRPQLIRLADMMHSRHLVDDCLRRGVYADATNAYQLATESLSILELEPEDLPLAQDILTTLYLWYLAYIEQPRRMTLKELAEATLTTDDVLRAEDSVAYVLSTMQPLRQVDFDNESATFVPAGGDDGFSIVALFNEHKRRAIRDRYKLQNAWTESLFFTPQETAGVSGFFHDFVLDTTATRRVRSRNLEYSGEVILSSSWRLDHGLALAPKDVHFRLIILTAEAVQSVNAEDLQDPRIAVVLPGEMSDEVREAAAAYVAWHTMEEETQQQSGRQAEEIRSWLDSQKHRTFSDLAATHLKLYQAGRVVSRDNVAINVRDAFGQGGGNERCIAHTVERLLTAAHRNLPITPDRLRGVLTALDTGKVFEGYFNRNPSTAQVTATRNYGVGLDLSRQDNPGRFDPQQNPVFSLIEGMLAGREGGDLPVWQLFDELSDPPFGLPYVVIQLYLLAFVRRGSPRVDLLLKPNHKLRNRDRQSITRDRLTTSAVASLDWKPGLEGNFDSLVPGTGPMWNDVLPYAREVADSLRTTTDQADIERQTEYLCQTLARMQPEVNNLQHNLEALAGTLNAALPQAATQAMHDLEQLTTEVPSSYADFYEKTETLFATPEALRDSMQTYVRLGQLAAVAAEISSTRRYLDEIKLRPNDVDLAADRITLLTQMALEGLVDSPETWRRLRADFEQFRKRYRNEYRKHHRDYYQAVAQLQDSLADVPHRVQALTLLNHIEGLGPQAGADLEQRYQELRSQLRSCAVTEVADVTVEHVPSCNQCGLQLTDAPPEEEAAAFLTELEGALTARSRQLASETVRRVLAQGDRADMGTFLEAAQAADLAALVDVMNPDLADFINCLLAQESIVTEEAAVLARLAEQYPSMEQSEIDAVVEALRQLLVEAFAQARQTHPDKETIRLSLR